MVPLVTGNPQVALARHAALLSNTRRSALTGYGPPERTTILFHPVIGWGSATGFIKDSAAKSSRICFGVPGAY